MSGANPPADRGVRAFDLAVVGGGIVGIAHALAGAKAGLKTVVVERDRAANGASIRNFGFVTVTGQAFREVWPRARRTREIWADLAPRAGLAVLHRGLVLAAHRPEAVAVLEAFMDGPTAHGCELLPGREAAARFPMLRAERLNAALVSPHELRIEAREAIPRLWAHLERDLGVGVMRGVAVHAVAPGRLATSAGEIRAEHIVVAPGPDLRTLFGEIMAQARVRLCRLHMLRLAPQAFRMPSAVMADLSLVRYGGYTDLPPVPALRARLEAEVGASLAHGIHLIAVQSADGSLVVGDSHHDGDPPSPFAADEVDRLILGHAQETLALTSSEVVERWLGVYPTADEPFLIARPHPTIRLAMVTCGAGMSTAFALGEEVIGELTGKSRHAGAPA
ncbi:MAG: TIGR03364 family FAD-dependent oxidoreductase [Alphaproteobacteria bacterium]|nr:TIGR03364 family FAD-dependent oxidoreductase [Alphaproteobacteria bacterium]